MGKNNQMREWIAHVGLAAGVSEVTVWGANRWDASDAVYRKFGLDGAADKQIKSFKMEEAALVRAASSPEVIPDVPKRDKSKDKRFRVRVYLSPRSGDLKQYNLRTDTADSALWSVMQMFKVKKESDLGPYCVEEVKDGVLFTVKWNQIHTFVDRGPIVATSGAYDPAPRQTPRSVGYAEDQLNDDWSEENWPGMSESYYDRYKDRYYGPAAKRESFLKEVASIFANEKLVTKPKVELVRR